MGRHEVRSVLLVEKTLTHSFGSVVAGCSYHKLSVDAPMPPRVAHAPIFWCTMSLRLRQQGGMLTSDFTELECEHAWSVSMIRTPNISISPLLFGSGGVRLLLLFPYSNLCGFLRGFLSLSCMPSFDCVFSFRSFWAMVSFGF